MASERLDVTEAERRFRTSSIVSFLSEHTYLLTQDGTVVAKLTPVDRAPTGSELASRWRERPRLDPADAAVWAEELAALKADGRQPD